MTADGPPTGRSRGVSPFVAFAAVALVAGVGAVWEISYWVGVSAFTGALIGTTLGIGAALVGFFAWGLYAPAND
jgi:hypothetical protein